MCEIGALHGRLQRLGRRLVAFDSMDLDALRQRQAEAAAAGKEVGDPARPLQRLLRFGKEQRLAFAARLQEGTWRQDHRYTTKGLARPTTHGNGLGRLAGTAPA